MPEQSQRIDRQIVLSELRDCLESTKLGGVAGQYELRDVSLSTLTNWEMSGDPLELALVVRGWNNYRGRSSHSL